MDTTRDKNSLLSAIDRLNKPYKIYADVEALEERAIKQFMDVMQNEAILQGALMPDAHTGYTLPIGGVIASKNTIFPSFVGYDIGCGMIAVPTTYSKEQIDTPDMKKKIFDQIYRDVPVGFNWRKNEEPWDYSDLEHTKVIQYLIK